MARAHFRDSLLDRLGNALANATITVYEAGSTTAIAQSMYALPVGGSPLSNPRTTDINGAFEFYLPFGQRVNLKVQAAGMADATIPYLPVLPDPAELVTMDGAQTLTGKTLTSAQLNAATLDEATFTGVALFDDDGIAKSDDLNTGLAWTAADKIALRAGGVDILKAHATGVTINYSGGGSPVSELYVEKLQSSGSHVMADFVFDSDAPATSDSGALRAVARQMTTGSTSLRGVESQVLRGSAASLNKLWGVEVGVHSEKAGAAVDDNVGIYLSMWHSGWLPTGVRGDTGILIGGEDGWKAALRTYDTDGSTLLHRFVSQTTGGDVKGDIEAKARVYSTGLGGTRLGFLDPSSAGSGETWSGIWYDPSSLRLIIEAVTQGTGWRDVWIAKNAGTLRVGPLGETVWKDLQLAVCSADLTLTTTPTDIAGCSVTLTPGVWSVTGTFWVVIAGAGDNTQNMIGVLAASGGTIANSGSAVVAAGNAGDAVHASMEWKLTITAGTPTVKLRGYKSGGSGTSYMGAANTVISARYLGNP